jgi:hypothetical protein
MDPIDLEVARLRPFPFGWLSSMIARVYARFAAWRLARAEARAARRVGGRA